MIPKKIRRIITVNNDEWEWCVTGHKDQPKVYAHNLKTEDKINWWCEGECKITPKDIKALIMTKVLFGIPAKKN